MSNDNTGGILELIYQRLDTIAQVQKGLASKEDMKTIAKSCAIDVIQQHERDKHADIDRRLNELTGKVGENTGVFQVVKHDRGIRHSLAPAARAVGALPLWAKVLIPALTIIGGLLGVDTSGLVNILP